MKTQAHIQKAIQWHQAEILRLNRRIAEITDSAASATLSSGEGSKSYTNHGVESLQRLVVQHQRSIVALERQAANALPVVRRVYTTRR